MEAIPENQPTVMAPWDLAAISTPEEREAERRRTGLPIRIGPASMVMQMMAKADQPALPPQPDVWQVNTDDGFKPLDKPTVALITEAEQRGEDSITFTFGEWDYKISMAELKQTNLTTGKARRLKKAPLAAGAGQASAAAGSIMPVPRAAPLPQGVSSAHGTAAPMEETMVPAAAKAGGALILAKKERSPKEYPVQNQAYDVMKSREQKKLYEAQGARTAHYLHKHASNTSTEGRYYRPTAGELAQIGREARAWIASQARALAALTYPAVGPYISVDEPLQNCKIISKILRRTGIQTHLTGEAHFQMGMSGEFTEVASWKLVKWGKTQVANLSMAMYADSVACFRHKK